LNKVLEALARRPFAVIGHRGARGRVVENTLSALRYAIRTGADIAEFDVQRTRDGVFVASHDPVITSRDGRKIGVREASYSEIALIELPGGERVPRIEELLGEARGRIALFLEIKEPIDSKGLVELVLREKAEDYVAVISFYEEAIRVAKSAYPSIPGGLIYFQPPGLITLCKRLGCEIVLPRYPLATEKAIRYAHRLGLRVVAWTVNEERWFLELYRRGVNGIATDYPDLGVRVREELRGKA